MGIHLKIASIRVTSRRTAHSNAQPITSTRRNLGLPRGAIGLVLAACAAFLISCGGVTGSFNSPLDGGGNGQLTLNPTSLDFGDVTVGNSSTQTAKGRDGWRCQHCDQSFVLFSRETSLRSKRQELDQLRLRSAKPSLHRGIGRRTFLSFPKRCESCDLFPRKPRRARR